MLVHVFAKNTLILLVPKLICIRITARLSGVILCAIGHQSQWGNSIDYYEIEVGVNIYRQDSLGVRIGKLVKIGLLDRELMLQ
jgi:hypothetical protein